MKLSVSLSESDLAALDEFVQTKGLGSRSAGVQWAIRHLGRADLEREYADAWDEWAATGDEALWDTNTADGIVDATR